MSWEGIIIEPSEIAVQTEEMTNALEQNGAPIDSAAPVMSWTQALGGAWEERRLKRLDGGNGTGSGADGKAMPHLTAGVFRVMEEYGTTGKPTRSFQDLMARGGIQSLGSWKEFVERSENAVNIITVVQTEEGREITFPRKITGEFNGEVMNFYPLKNWGHLGKGNYKPGIQKDEEGRYLIAVAPKIIDPDYPDEGKVWVDDFNDCPKYINLVVVDAATNEEKIIECVVYDIKAHSYNTYPDGQPYDTGNVASFDVENGWVQTGIAYPNSDNAKKDRACAGDCMNGNIIEFAGHELDFELNDYTLKKIIVLDEMD